MCIRKPSSKQEGYGGVKYLNTISNKYFLCVQDILSTMLSTLQILYYNVYFTYIIITYELL